MRGDDVMKMQHNFLVSGPIVMLISFVIAMKIQEKKICYDIVIGILSGSVMTVLLAIVEHLMQKKENLEVYWFTLLDLYDWSSRADSNFSKEEYLHWYIEYKRKLESLSFQWSKIAYLCIEYI